MVGYCWLSCDCRGCCGCYYPHPWWECFSSAAPEGTHHTTPHHATPRHATPRHATPRHATPHTSSLPPSLPPSTFAGPPMASQQNVFTCEPGKRNNAITIYKKTVQSSPTQDQVGCVGLCFSRSRAALVSTVTKMCLCLVTPTVCGKSKSNSASHLHRVFCQFDQGLVPDYCKYDKK